MSRFVRVLPTLGICLLGVLALRIGEISTGVETVGKAWAAGAPKAKDHGDAPAAHPATPVEKQPVADAGPPETGAPEHAEGHEAAARAAPRPASRPPIPGEDAFVSPAEIQVLESLTRRREDLDKRAAALDMREKLLATTEQRLGQKLAEIRKIEDAIKSSIRTLSEQEAAQIASLVKVYETMKPKEAAAILQGLNRTVLIDVAARMKEAKMSAILAAMDPEKAREVTVLLATRVEIPGVGTAAAIAAPKPSVQ